MEFQTKCDHLVEGHWKNFIFKKITPNHYPEILEHVNTYFFRDEITCQLLGYTDQFACEMTEVIIEMLGHNLSFQAVDESTNEVAGVLITFRAGENQTLHSLEKTFKDYRTDVFMNQTDIPEHVREEMCSKWKVKDFAEMFIASTNPNYRNKGLSTELLNRVIRFLHAEGFTMIECIFTSDITRRMAEKLGFQPYYKMAYKDLLDESGRNIFRTNKITDEDYALAMIKIDETKY